MRLPNGFGSVYKLSGKRRKPWVAMVTVDWSLDQENKTAKQNRKAIGYFKSRIEAYNALVDYHNNPFDIDNKITFKEVFDRWFEEKDANLSRSSITGYQAAFKAVPSLHDMQLNTIKLSHLQGAIDISGKNKPLLRRVKTLFNHLFAYAIAHEIITPDKNVVQYVDISKAKNPNKLDRSPFTKKEIDLLWKHQDNYSAKIVLVMIYTGVRISELLNIKKEQINLEERYFDIDKSKTQSSVRRVPIAKKIVPFIEEFINSSEIKWLLVNAQNKKMQYSNFRDSYFDQLMLELNIKRRPHDTRHTTVSLLVEQKVDQRVIRSIVGHAGQGVTEKYYTHFDLKPLLEAINLI